MRREKKNSHEKKMRKRISDRTTTLEFHNELRLTLNCYYNFNIAVLLQDNTRIIVWMFLKPGPFDILVESDGMIERSFEKKSSLLPLLCCWKKALKIILDLASSIKWLLSLYKAFLLKLEKKQTGQIFVLSHCPLLIGNQMVLL